MFRRCTKITATALALAVFVVLFDYPWPVVVFGIAGAAAVILVHRLNIRRLLGRVHTVVASDAPFGTTCDDTGHFVATLNSPFNTGVLKPGTATITVASFSTGEFVIQTVRLAKSHPSRA